MSKNEIIGYLPSKEDIEKLRQNSKKLQDIWNNRPEGLTFPQEYLDIKQRNTEIHKEVDKLNDQIDALLRQTVQNTERAAIILRNFTKGKSEEELAQYIEPNKIFMTPEEILIARAGEKLHYRFRPASFQLMYPDGFNIGLVCDEIKKDNDEVNVEITDDEREMLLGSISSDT